MLHLFAYVMLASHEGLKVLIWMSMLKNGIDLLQVTKKAHWDFILTI